MKIVFVSLFRKQWKSTITSRNSSPRSRVKETLSTWKTQWYQFISLWIDIKRAREINRS